MWQRVKFALMPVLVFVIVFVTDSQTGQLLSQNFGLIPGELAAIWHIYTAPWLHGNLSHLINNTVGFLVFSVLCLLSYSVRWYLFSSLVIITLSGLLVWGFGRQAIHIGASGWIFGLWSFIIAMAWYDRSLKSIVIGLTVAVLYSSMIYGLLPQTEDVSFEYHISGGFSGVLSAWLGTKFRQTLYKS